jgi:hypothetical protein
MEQNEINQLADLTAARLYNLLLADSKFINLLAFTSPEGQEATIEATANKVLEKFIESGAFDMDSMDIDKVQNLVNQLQINQEPEIVVKRLDEE